MGFEISFDEFQKNLERLERNFENTVQDLNGIVSIEKLFTDNFMKIHTAFSDANSWFEAGKIHFDSQEEFDALDESTLDTYVESSTDFSSWREML